MIPTTPWEAAFRGIALWLGIEDFRMDEVCPNLQNFNSSYMIEFEEMFNGVSIPPIISFPPSSKPTTRNNRNFSPNNAPEMSRSMSPSEISSTIPPSMTPMSSQLPTQTPPSKSQSSTSRRNTFLMYSSLLLSLNLYFD